MYGRRTASNQKKGKDPVNDMNQIKKNTVKYTSATSPQHLNEKKNKPCIISTPGTNASASTLNEDARLIDLDDVVVVVVIGTNSATSGFKGDTDRREVGTVVAGDASAVSKVSCSFCSSWSLSVLSAVVALLVVVVLSAVVVLLIVVVFLIAALLMVLVLLVVVVVSFPIGNSASTDITGVGGFEYANLKGSGRSELKRQRPSMLFMLCSLSRSWIDIQGNGSDVMLLDEGDEGGGTV